MERIRICLSENTLKLIDFEDYLEEEYGAIGTPERTKYEAEVTAEMTELQQKVAEEQVIRAKLNEAQEYLSKDEIHILKKASKALANFLVCSGLSMQTTKTPS